MINLRRVIVRRAAATLAAGALISTAVAGTAYAAPAADSGTWLSHQLTDGLVHNNQYKFDDYGLTADTALALSALGGQSAGVRDIRKALAQHVDSWTTGVDYGSDDIYSGSTAKAVVVAQTTGADPRHFGGVNLVGRLRARVSDTAPTVGRLQDRSATDYANTIGQAFAARGLSVAGASEAPDAVRFLLAQQCSAGYFRLTFADPTAADQSCDAGDPGSTSAPDTDVTALAVLNLEAVPHKTSAVKTAITGAVRWLKRNQKTNGSFGGGTATEASNSNSTGLAGWALGINGVCGAAAKAASWVRDLQVSGTVAGTPFAGEKGAIAYDRAAYKAAKTDGIGKAQRDQWRRATAQASPALRYLHTSACSG